MKHLNNPVFLVNKGNIMVFATPYECIKHFVSLMCHDFTRGYINPALYIEWHTPFEGSIANRIKKELRVLPSLLKEHLEFDEFIYIDYNDHRLSPILLRELFLHIVKTIRHSEDLIVLEEFDTILFEKALLELHK